MRIHEEDIVHVLCVPAEHCMWWRGRDRGEYEEPKKKIFPSNSTCCILKCRSDLSFSFFLFIFSLFLSFVTSNCNCSPLSLARSRPYVCYVNSSIATVYNTVQCTAVYPILRLYTSTQWLCGYRDMQKIMFLVSNSITLYWWIDAHSLNEQCVGLAGSRLRPPLSANSNSSWKRKERRRYEKFTRCESN